MTVTLTPLDEAVQRIRAMPARPLPVENVAIEAADGRILAADLVAPAALPRWDYSAMDGYAFAFADLEVASARALPVSHRIPAGRWGEPLQPGTAARIFTGSPIPAGADTVVPQELCRVEPDGVKVEKLPRRGDNIRRAGEDIAAGSRCLGAGRRLRPADLALAASLGFASLPVKRRLKVAVLSTGDELVRPGEELAPGQIYGSNNVALRALLERCGCAVQDFGFIPDRPEATFDALERAAKESDLIVTSGGVSVGEEDHVRAAVERLGRLDLWRLDIKPGKPLAWGKVADTPIVGLPGNPVSSFVTALLVLLPCVHHLQGRPPIDAQAWPVRAAFEWPKPDKRREFMRARVRIGAEGPEALLYRDQGSGAISSIAWMEGLIDLPGGQVVRAGDRVNYLPLDALLET